ncbi:MAG: hypothetical protein DWQ01_01435 [Planctomycetota bacterium]|nr:MAG: hypothetical protein DWQ01_01435 [Planctomycetota bacterium]
MLMASLRACLFAFALSFSIVACSDSSASADEEDGEASLHYTESIQGSTVEFDMVWIDQGGFWIGRTEVTWDEYLLYCDFEQKGEVPPDADAVSKPSKPLDWVPYDHNWGVGRRPAVGMSWNAAKKYCEWLSMNTGHRYRLPTEEEWQMACGQGGSGPLADRAWFADNSEEKSQEVGQKAANEHGLYDVLGNLWEYCGNPYDPSDSERAVLRGGSWKDTADQLTPENRLGFDEDWTLKDPNFPPGVWWIPDGNHLGFRILREGPEEGTSQAQ